MKNKELKRQLKNLHKFPVSESSLSLIKSNLKGYMNFYTPKKESFVENKSKTISDFRFPTLKVATVMVIIALVLGSGRAVYASLDSLPGDALYPIKIMAEDLGKIVIFDQEKKAEYEIKLAEKRVGEINTILSKEKFEEKDIKTAEKLLEKHLKKAQEISNMGSPEFKNKIQNNIQSIYSNQNNSENSKIKKTEENKNETRANKEIDGNSQKDKEEKLLDEQELLEADKETGTGGNSRSTDKPIEVGKKVEKSNNKSNGR